MKNHSVVVGSVDPLASLTHCLAYLAIVVPFIDLTFPHRPGQHQNEFRSVFDRIVTTLVPSFKDLSTVTLEGPLPVSVAVWITPCRQTALVSFGRMRCEAALRCNDNDIPP